MLKRVLKKIGTFLLVVIVSLAIITVVTKNNPVIWFENTYMRRVPVRKVKLNHHYWNEENNTLVTPNGTIELLAWGTTEGFTYYSDSETGSNLLLYYQFVSKEDNQRPHQLFIDNFSIIQDNKVLEDGGITNQNDSVQYQDLVNNGVEFYNTGESTTVARVLYYDTSKGDIHITVEGKTYLLKDLIPDVNTYNKNNKKDGDLNEG